MTDNIKPVRPWDLLLKKERTEKEIRENRLNICRACPEFINLTKQCSICKCFMDQKVKLPDASCPLLKWGPDQSANINVVSGKPNMPEKQYNENIEYKHGKNGKDTFYHLHIPKTGGTYARQHLTRFLSNNLKENGIKEIVAHHGWTHVTPSTYIFTTLRDPAKRTVSHFAYSLLVNGYFNNPEYTDEFIKNMFLEWIDKPENQYVRNYQSKNLFFIKSKENKFMGDVNKNSSMLLDDGFLFAKQKDFLAIDLSDKDIFSRVKEIDMIIQDKDLNDYTCSRAIEEISNSFGFEYKHNPIILPEIPNDNINVKSNILFSSLSDTEIDYLYRINNLDSELYFTEDIYWRP